MAVLPRSYRIRQPGLREGGVMLLGLGGWFRTRWGGEEKYNQDVNIITSHLWAREGWWGCDDGNIAENITGTSKISICVKFPIFEFNGRDAFWGCSLETPIRTERGDGCKFKFNVHLCITPCQLSNLHCSSSFQKRKVTSCVFLPY